MRQRINNRAILAASLALMISWAGIALGESPQTKAPAPDTLVITPTNTVILDASVYAGRWLQSYLIRAVAKAPDADAYASDAKPEPNRAASANFPVFRKASELPPGKNVLVVGNAKAIGAPYLSEADHQRLEERDGTVLIRRQGNVVVITVSGENNWNFSAIRIFLDRCAGVRLYAPSDDNLWVSMPKENQFTIGQLDFFQRPFFATASLSTVDPRNTEWTRMNTPITEGASLRATHAIINYFPPAKYYAKYPEIYPMAANGTRPLPSGIAWNPSLENPELLARIAMDGVREHMHSKPPPPYLSFGVMDYVFDSQDPISQAERKKYNGSLSNLFYDFLNRVARACQKEFPKLYLTASVYANVRTPPVGMTIESNIVVDVAVKSYNWVEPAALAAEKEHILSFASLGAGWTIHDWCFSGVTPRIYNRQYADFLQWAAQNQMKGAVIEWSPGEAWYVDGANYWVLDQLLSNPYQDVDALWRQYCNDMYGTGAEAMYRFYGMFAEKHVFSDKYYERNDIPRQEMAGFTPADLALQRGWLESAIAQTKDDPLIQKRLALVLRYFRGHELFAEAVGEPARLYHTYTVLDKKTGINQAALAFYVNDDGKKLLEAVDYYDTKRTIPPDNNKLNVYLGAPLSYRANYSRALGTILQAVRTEALQGVDISHATAQTVKDVTTKSAAIFRANLPAKYDAARARDLGALFQKILWIPRGPEMPKFDGDLTDPAWKGAVELTDFTLADLLLPSQAGNETTGKIMRVGDSLVIGLICKQPKGVWAKTTPDIQTGTTIWRESGAEIFFIPQSGEAADKPYAQYVVNALGAFRGFAAAKDVREGVQCAAKLDKEKGEYTLEVALPLKTVQYDYTQEHVFSFTIMRDVYNADTFSPIELLGWYPLFRTAQNPQSRGLVFIQ